MSQEANPYRSPQVASPAANFTRPTQYASASVRATLAILLLGVVLSVRLVAAAAAYAHIRALAVGAERVELLAVLATLENLLFLASGVTFVVWMYRANQNLRALGNRRIEYTPGWTVGGWMIPIGNWFYPYQIMSEIWTGSHPETLHWTHGKRVPGLSLVRWWWAFWLLMTVVVPMVGLIVVLSIDVPRNVGQAWLKVLTDLVAVPAAVLAIAVVRGATANQEKRHVLYEQTKPDEPEIDFAAMASPSAAELSTDSSNPFQPPPDEPPSESSGSFSAPWLKQP